MLTLIACSGEPFSVGAKPRFDAAGSGGSGTAGASGMPLQVGGAEAALPAPLMLWAAGMGGAFSDGGDGPSAGGEDADGSAGAGMAMLEYATVEDTVQRGPFTTDSSMVRDACPSGSVLIGLNAQLDQGVVGQLQGVCGVPTLGPMPGQLTIEPGRSLLWEGDAAGELVTRSCPSGSAVVAFQGRSGALLDQLQLDCAPLLLSGDALVMGEPVAIEPIGNLGGSPFERAACADSAVAAGIRVSVDHWIVGVGLTCARVSLSWQTR